MLPITAPATLGALVEELVTGASVFAADDMLFVGDEVRLRFPPTKPDKLADPLDWLLLDCKSGIVDVDNVLGGMASGVV